MMRTVYSEFQRLKDNKQYKQVQIILMTDFIDNPPPVAKNDRYEFDMVNSGTTKEYWIYMLNF
jgi:hypothetical protein